MSSQTIDQLVECVERIPRLPDTAMRLISTLSDPGSSIGEIVDCIRYDQAITAEVLRLCNSAYFGLSRRVNSIDDATRLLGTAKVLQLVMSAHTQALLSRPQEGYGLIPGALWEHSVAVALGSQHYARHLGLHELGQLFTAGLLHDIGKVVLNEFVAAEFAAIVDLVTRKQMSFLEAEQQVLGYTHPEVGIRLAEVWSLPEDIARCIRYHHTPDDLPEPDAVVDTVHLADATCLLMGIGGGEVDGLAYRLSSAVLERAGLDMKKLESLGAEIVAELKSVKNLFGHDS